MIDLHFWTAPSDHKITIFLERTGRPYRIVPVNISTYTRAGAINTAPTVSEESKKATLWPDRGGDDAMSGVSSV